MSMRSCAISAIAAILLAAFSPAHAQVQVQGARDAASSAIQARIQELVSSRYSAYRAAHGLPEGAGVLVHLQTPTGSWTAAAGLPSGADETWHYRIASVSKTFTAASIMLLDQRGMLRIDDTLSSPVPGTDYPYLPDSPAYAIPYRDRITIRQVLSHRAGVFDVFNGMVPADAAAPYAGENYAAWIKQSEPDHLFSAAELIGVSAANKLSYWEPGTDYHYSDTGFTLLARIVERVSGMSFDRFLAENFFGPMGLTRTYSPWSPYDSMPAAPFLRGWVSAGEGWFDATESNMSDQIGPGGIVSTAADAAKWIRTLGSGKGPLTLPQMARMNEPPAGNPTYALGLGNSALGMGHSGAHPGYVNIIGYNPDDDCGVVVATPFIDYTNLPDHLAFIVEVGLEAKRIAGYTAPWPRK